MKSEKIFYILVSKRLSHIEAKFANKRYFSNRCYKEFSCDKVTWPSIKRKFSNNQPRKVNCIFQANLINKTVYLIKLQRKNAFVSSIVLKTKVLIEVIIFTSPTSADPPPTHPSFTWSFEPREGLANFRGKGSTFIYQLFQDPKKGPIQPTN